MSQSARSSPKLFEVLRQYPEAIRSIRGSTGFLETLSKLFGAPLEAPLPRSSFSKPLLGAPPECTLEAPLGAPLEAPLETDRRSSRLFERLEVVRSCSKQRKAARSSQAAGLYAVRSCSRFFDGVRRGDWRQNTWVVVAQSTLRTLFCWHCAFFTSVCNIFVHVDVM